MKTKKFLSAMLALCLCFSTLTACKNTENTESESTKKVKNTENTESESTKKVKDTETSELESMKQTIVTTAIAGAEATITTTLTTAQIITATTTGTEATTTPPKTDEFDLTDLLGISIDDAINLLEKKYNKYDLSTYYFSYEGDGSAYIFYMDQNHRYNPFYYLEVPFAHIMISYDVKSSLISGITFYSLPFMCDIEDDKGVRTPEEDEYNYPAEIKNALNALPIYDDEKPESYRKAVETLFENIGKKLDEKLIKIYGNNYSELIYEDYDLKGHEWIIHSNDSGAFNCAWGYSIDFKYFAFSVYKK